MACMYPFVFQTHRTQYDWVTCFSMELSLLTTPTILDAYQFGQIITVKYTSKKQHKND